MTWFEVAASFPGGGMREDVPCCFDPRIVMFRLRDEFGDLVESEFKDVSWDAHDRFLEIGAVEGAIRSARNDGMRRGPNFPFKIRWEGETYQGNAERYVVRLSSPKPIPEALRRRFRAFLEKLTIVPFGIRDLGTEESTTTGLA